MNFNKIKIINSIQDDKVTFAQNIKWNFLK